MSVYVLRDPRTGACRYVGRSYDPVDRLRSHRRGRSAPRVAAWIADLKSAGLVPQLEVVDSGTEAEWIKKLGPDLNVAHGLNAPEPASSDARCDLRVSPEEKDLFTRAAEADGLTLSTWIRRVAKAAARKLLGDDPEKKRGRR